MSKKRIAAFFVFYIGIVLAILFMHFYVQERYGRKPDRRRTEAPYTPEAFFRAPDVSCWTIPFRRA